MGFTWYLFIDRRHHFDASVRMRMLSEDTRSTCDTNTYAENLQCSSATNCFVVRHLIARSDFSFWKRLVM